MIKYTSQSGHYNFMIIFLLLFFVIIVIQKGESQQ